MILTALDNLITQRWRRMLYNGEPIKLYPYLPDRDKNETVYPSVGFQRIVGGALLHSERRHGPIFIPSEQEATTDVDRVMGGGTTTGPAAYTVKPFQTPTACTYEFHTLATDKELADLMLQYMYQVIPPDFCPTVEYSLRLETVAAAGTCSGTEAGPVTIMLNVNDKVKLQVSGGPQQTVTLSPGVGISISTIAGEINTQTTGLTASVHETSGVLVLTADDVADDLIVVTITNNAYTLLGLTTGIYENIEPDRLVQQKPVFTHDHPVHMDDLSKPEFRTSFIYRVAPLWLDRLEEYQLAPITTMDIEFAPREWT